MASYLPTRYTTRRARKPAAPATPAPLDLGAMLTYRRPARSATEDEFIATYIDPVPGMQRDDYGNRWLIVGDGRPAVMFSAHTDTVHTDEGRQRVCLDEARGEYFLPDDSGSNCLGADDAAGVYVLLRLIGRGVPGLYVFHRDEETGGRGSVHFARHHDMAGIRQCVAIDRKGFGSVITHQGGRTCSDQYARALAAALGGQFAPDDTGTFTDSANYVDRVPECTNVSVGYARQHSRHETQCATFPDLLADKLAAVDWAALPICRALDDQDEPTGRRAYYRHGRLSDRIAAAPMTYAEALDLIGTDPDAVACYLVAAGASAQDVDDAAADAALDFHDFDDRAPGAWDWNR